MTTKIRANVAGQRMTLTLGSGLTTTGDTVTASGEGGAAWGGITGTLADQSDINSALSGKAASGHNHDSEYAAIGHTHESGSDPWTYVRLTSDFTTSSNTAVAVTGINFAPSANNRYEIYGMFMLRTATATVGPRPGVSWPTGLSDGAARFFTPSSATANLNTNGNIAATMIVAVGGLPSTTGSWLGTFEALIVCGASPSGNVQLNLASETAGTVVTMKAGSFIKYRLIP